jgi:hypothetical protein
LRRWLAQAREVGVSLVLALATGVMVWQMAWERGLLP